MCLLPMRPAAVASLRKRASTPSSRENCTCINLMATVRLTSMFSAFQTAPMPPSPSCLTKRNLPSRTRPSSGTSRSVLGHSSTSSACGWPQCGHGPKPWGFAIAAPSYSTDRDGLG